MDGERGNKAPVQEIYYYSKRVCKVDFVIKEGTKMERQDSSRVEMTARKIEKGLIFSPPRCNDHESEQHGQEPRSGEFWNRTAYSVKIIVIRVDIDGAITAIDVADCNGARVIGRIQAMFFTIF